MFSGSPSELLVDPLSLRSSAHVKAWPTLLVVDTDEQVTRTLVCFFEKRGFHVAAGTSIAEAGLYFHRRKSWTLIIADYHLPDGTGVELCDWVRSQGCDAPVLLMSANPGGAALCAGFAYLPKPFRIEELESYVRKLQHRA